MSSGQFINRKIYILILKSKALGLEMPTCAECGKKVGFFDGQFSINSQNAAYFCGDKCKREFQEKKNLEREMQKKDMTKEIKCKCNHCGMIWHYLESREKEIEKNIKVNAGIQTGFAFWNIGAATQAKRNVEAQQDLLDKLKKCPECGSHDITKKDIYYEKK